MQTLPPDIRLSGMATPFGVYISTGKYASGGGRLGFFLLGGLFTGLILLSRLMSNLLFRWILPVFHVQGSIESYAACILTLIFILVCLSIGNVILKVHHI